mmetsp:Transcript_16131/g.50709  ORF Transcript_16131/g.50709 Transcript_16131/m.50709 type:complete len:576 (+) Transcript_16131:92-1819(+)
MGNMMRVLVDVFFRQVDVVGRFRIPDEGPVIFVANHSNQFVDPLMLSYCAERPVRFLCAAKSMRRPLIGRLARAARAIGVERPQDLATKGRGTISIEAGSTQLAGAGTAFCSELHPGCKVHAGGVELAVKSVESDVACTVAAASAGVSASAFKVFPKIDQGDTFTTVHEALKARDCIGIFPEGGSHDRPGLLDLKPGVAIMALGAMVEGSAPVQIVPCGMTYFEAHRFRSRAIVEFGTPVEVPAALAERYKTDKRGAVAELMSSVEDALTAVVPKAANYKELQALITMKALYKPRDHRLTPEESLKLTKSFTSAAAKSGPEGPLQEVIRLVEEYNAMLRAKGARDRDVRRSAAGRNFTLSAAGALLQVLLLSPLALPAMLLWLPVALATTLLAEKERRKALAGSSVKVKATDVVASYKILVALVLLPVYNLLAAVAVAWLSGAGIWLLPLCFVLQPVLAYFLILLCDHYIRCAKCVAAIAYFGCSCSGATGRLEERRAQLQQKVRALVEELGPQFDSDFEATRVDRQESRQRLLKDGASFADAEPAVHVLDAGGLADLLTPGGGEGKADPLLQRQ